MPELTQLNVASIILDISAVIIAFGILCETRFMRRSGRKADILFFRLLILTMIIAVADMAGYITEGRADPLMIKIQIISMTVFYLSFVILSISWFDYCKYKFKDRQKESGTQIRAVHVLGLLTIAAVIFNLFTGIIFSVDNAGAYHRGIGFIPVYIVMAAYVAAGFVMVGRYRTVGKKKLIPLWLYVLPVVFGIVVTFVVSEVSMASLGAAISIAFTHLGTMNEVAEISIRETAK